ncbi:uncharacterized protein LOC129595182 [Paramacrobiotus metropolitanus]|uniref:uncharacterized protein LOC129595182 n=1 Tax=Paramacrobiotus metropolitanus TaxID=2943436 RepID=UPI00244570EB|nr:uncharacterized protein LOC129595182 [Paramacrobiotus metropolitanus]
MPPLHMQAHGIILMLLFNFTLGNNREDESQPHNPGIFIPFPRFSVELMTRDQCLLQFTTNCAPPNLARSRCATQHGLMLACSSSAKAPEIKQLAFSLSKPPLKAISVSLHDGEHINSGTLSAVRDQTLVLHLHNCTSSRVTNKLSQLRMPHLLEFGLHNCRDLNVRRADFYQSRKLRLIQFVNTTVDVLEADTFTDLPALRLLSLESGLSGMEVFDNNVQVYIARLHCSCEFQWFRRWWQANGLLREALEGEIYNIPYDSWRNWNVTRNDVVLPVDCSSLPNGSASIDFTQQVYSANEELYKEKRNTECYTTTTSTGNVHSYPLFSTEPRTDKECRLVLTYPCAMDRLMWDVTVCAPSVLESYNASYAMDVIEFYNGTNATFDTRSCSIERVLTDTKRLVTVMAKQSPWAILLSMAEKEVTALQMADLQPVRPLIIAFNLLNCTTARCTNRINTLNLFNLVHVAMMDCRDLDVKRKDFQRTKKLRVIEFWNATIRTLEVNVFSDLPAVRVVALELDIISSSAPVPGTPVDVLDHRVRDYLFRLHCSCEFAWYREWWQNNTAPLRHTEVPEGGVYIFPSSWQNQQYRRGELFLPIDCAVEIPTAAASVNLTQEEFSRNEPKC